MLWLVEVLVAWENSFAFVDIGGDIVNLFMFISRGVLFWDNDCFLEILPEMVLIIVILFNLVVSLQLNASGLAVWYRWLYYFIAVFCCCCFKVFLGAQWIVGGTKIIFGSVWLDCFYTNFSKLVILSLTIVVIIISKKKFSEIKSGVLSEFLIIIGFAVLFMLFLASAYDLLVMYISVEGLSLALYVMAARTHSKFVAIEAAIKYFALGALSSGIMLYGISLFFGIFGALDFISILFFLGKSQAFYMQSAILNIGFLCVVFGFFFKIGAFPCHIWTPDVYEGVWTPVTAFFAIVVKLSLFFFFIRLLYNVYFSFLILWQPIFIFVAIGSIVVGALGALDQVRVKRFIAFASINQVGFFFLGVSCGTITGVVASIGFIMIYAIMSIGIFTILLNTKHLVTRGSLVYLSDLSHLGIQNPWASKSLGIIVLSMAGIPPLGGFFGKLFLYYALLGSFLDTVAFVTLLVNIISSYYYINIIRYLWFEKKIRQQLFFYEGGTVLQLLLKIICGLLVFFMLLVPVFYYTAYIATISMVAPLVTY
jgi:NADH-quinone oxidoreductase subunit N